MTTDDLTAWLRGDLSLVELARRAAEKEPPKQAPGPTGEGWSVRVVAHEENEAAE